MALVYSLDRGAPLGSSSKDLAEEGFTLLNLQG